MHPRSTLLRAASLAALGLAALGVGACGDDDEEASKPKTLSVSIDQAGKLTAPSSTEGGVVTLNFANKAKKPYSLQMVRVTGNKTGDDVLKVIMQESGSIPSWLADGGGIGTVKPGQTGTTTQELPAGRWILVPGSEDDSRAKPQTAVLEVSGSGDGGELPKADASIDAFEYGFKASGLKAGRNTVEFSNTGKELHHVLAFPMVPGATLEQVKTFFRTEKGRPPVDFENGAETTVIDGGQKQVATLDLKAGKNVLVCFITDRAGGPVHAAKGMISETEVSAG